jgi:hypothetical protein
VTVGAGVSANNIVSDEETNNVNIREVQRAAQPAAPVGRTVPRPTWGPEVSGVRSGPTITTANVGTAAEAEATEEAAPEPEAT